MPPIDLTSARLKLDRAKHHLGALSDEETAFASVDENTYSIVTRRWTDGEGVEWEGEVVDEILRPLPIEWGLIAGDAIHNMRCALDHLVWALVVANGKKPTNQNQFPIYTYEPSPERIAERLARMNKVHADAIKQLQPHIDPESERSLMLTALANLDNLDKHKLVPPVYAFSYEISIEGDPPYDSRPEHIQFNYLAPLAPGVPLMRWRVEDSHRRPASGFMRYGVGYGSPRTGGSELEQLRVCVSEIVESFPGIVV